MASGLITLWQIEWGKVETMTDFILGGAPKSLQIVAEPTKLKDACSLKKSYDKSRQHIEKEETSLCQQRSFQSRLWFFQWSCMDVRVGL